MLQIRIKNKYLELNDNTNVQLTLRNPMFYKDNDGSGSFAFSIPASDNNRLLLGLFDRVQRVDVVNKFEDVQVLFDGIVVVECTLVVAQKEDGNFECAIGSNKGELNFKAANLKLTDLAWEQQTFTRERLGTPSSILNVTEKNWPDANFALFPVYNPGLFAGTWFDEYFRSTTAKFKEMVMKVWDTGIGVITMTQPPFGYFFKLAADGWISNYYDDADQKTHTMIEDWERKLDAYGNISDRYSNWVGDDPTRIYHFYRYFFEFVNTQNLQGVIPGYLNFMNEFYAAGWVNFIDVRFLDHTSSPGKFIVPFPYLVEVINKAIATMGYEAGENFLMNDDELKTLCIVTMNTADTGYGGLQTETDPLVVRISEHLPDISVYDLFLNIAKWFNVAVLHGKGRTIKIRKNIDILNESHVVDWSGGITKKSVGYDKKAYNYHLNVTDDDWWSEKVKQEGVESFDRLPTVYATASLPPAWSVGRINVVCYVGEQQAYYITAFEENNLVWKQYTMQDTDLKVEPGYDDEEEISCDAGYMINHYGFYMGSDSSFFHSQGQPNPYFEFPRCSIKGNALLHAISFDAEYHKNQLKLMFFRGFKPFTPHPVANGHYLPHGSASDKYLGEPVPGVKYSLAWAGDNGIYNRFWKDWIQWLNTTARPMSIYKQLTPLQLSNVVWDVKYKMDDVIAFIKEIRVDIGMHSMSAAEIDIVKV
jgi:hypothetical protein